MSNKNKNCSCGQESTRENQVDNLNTGQITLDNQTQKELKALIIPLILFTIGIIFYEKLQKPNWRIVEYAIFITTYLISGWNVLTNAGRNILQGEIFDENFLMTIATIGAIAIQELPEAAAVMLFFQIGELCQSYAVGKSRRSIRSLLEIRPNKANIIENGEIKEKSPEKVQVGDILIIKAGEKVPLDGEIITGKSQVDTSALTGESIPKTVREGETILAGYINQTASLKIRVTRKYTESSIAKIIDLVENAKSKKAPTEKLMTRIARYYTPIVVFLSLAIAIILPIFIPQVTRQEWVYRALVLLVISCPCGLVISIPLGYFGGVGGAAKKGILVKGSTFLDTLTAVKTVIFDKTGTLTQGVFQVTQIVPYNGYNQTELLNLAALAESQSNHPIARSILEAYHGEIRESEITNYQEISGFGIRAQVKGMEVLVGNHSLLDKAKIEHHTCNLQGTAVHVAAEGKYLGYILINDKLKEDAGDAILKLKQKGITKTIMLTGDNRNVAKDIANKLGIDHYQAELLPEDKVKAIEKYLYESNKKDKIAFVGDGINDAPVIVRADVGMAMGVMGSDAAIETADIVLMTDSPSKVVEAIGIAGKTHQIVWQNIILAMTVKAIFLFLGSLGIANLWSAVFADVGVALLAIFNATRVLKS